LDIAKNVFQVHGIDAAEKVVVSKQLRRGQVMKFFEALPPCLVGMAERSRLLQRACSSDQASLSRWWGPCRCWD
jgi:transposase